MANPLDVLTIADCEQIAQQTLQDEFKNDMFRVNVNDFKYEHQGNQCNGFLGDYYRLIITVNIDREQNCVSAYTNRGLEYSKMRAANL